MILSPKAYEWFVTGMIILISFGWVAVDVVRLRRYVKNKASHDEIFGSIIGIVLASLGGVGLFKYYLHL